MVLVLIAGGVWAVWSNWHRVRTPFSPAAPPGRPVVLRPTEVPGLGFLPDSTEAVLAVQVPFVLERLGPGADEDPIRALTSLGLPESVARMIDQGSVVGLKNVDQLVVGLSFADHSLPPLVVLVAHTRQSYDLASFARQMHASPLKKNGRTFYVGKAGPLPAVHWWQPSDRVLVAAILPTDLAKVPDTPRAGIAHLRPPLVHLIRDAVAEDSSAWFVATSDQWDRYLRPYTLLPLTPLHGRSDLIRPAERLRSVVVAVPDHPERPIDVRVGLKSNEAGAALRAALAERFSGQSVEVRGEGEWVRLELPNDPNELGPLMNRLIAGNP